MLRYWVGIHKEKIVDIKCTIRAMQELDLRIKNAVLYYFEL